MRTCPCSFYFDQYPWIDPWYPRRPWIYIPYIPAPVIRVEYDDPKLPWWLKRDKK